MIEQYLKCCLTFFKFHRLIKLNVDVESDWSAIFLLLPEFISIIHACEWVRAKKCIYPWCDDSMLKSLRKNIVNDKVIPNNIQIQVKHRPKVNNMITPIAPTQNIDETKPHKNSYVLKKDLAEMNCRCKYFLSIKFR